MYSGFLNSTERTPVRIKILLFFLVLSLSISTIFELEAAAGDDLRSKTQNPVGALISVPFKFSVDHGASNGSAYIMNIQPVIPVQVGEWNLINRVIAPIIHTGGSTVGIPSIINGGKKRDGSETGLGDINYSLFVSPADAGKVIWGVGPSISLPTATNSRLGSKKWSAGPTAVLLTQPTPWTLGVLGRQLWSFAGDSDRSSVSQFLVEPFVNYNLDDGWYLISDMVITSNWHKDSDDRWTVPLGGGAGKLFMIGKQAINSRLEFYNNVIRPSGAPIWSMSFTVQFLFPK